MINQTKSKGNTSSVTYGANCYGVSVLLNVNFNWIHLHGAFCFITSFRLFDKMQISIYSWSYGVLLWEIVTLAASPYPGMGAKEVVDFIKDGNRMEKPKHCSEEL